MPVRSHGGRVGGRAAGGGRGGSSRQERETGKLAGFWNVRSPGGEPCNLHEHGVQQHGFGGHPNAASMPAGVGGLSPTGPKLGAIDTD